MRSILVTDGHELAGLATARSVGRGGHRVVVALPRRRSPAAVERSRWVAGVTHSPDPWEESDAYEVWLAGELASGTFDAVFPVSEASMVAAVRCTDRRSGATVPIVMPGESGRALCLSKAHAVRVASDAGLTVPPTAFWYDGKEFDDAALDGWAYPFLVKADNVHTSVGTYRRGRAWNVADRAQLEVVRGGLKGLRCRAIAQAIVPGRGVSACLLVDHGRPLLEFGHRRLHEVPWTGGVSSLRRSSDDAQVAEAGRRMMAHASYEGLAMVEFRQSADGTLYFLEVNGRPWGSMALALHAGVDFPLAALNFAMAGGPSEEHGHTEVPHRGRVVCMNLVPGEIQHLRSIVRSGSLPAGRRRRLALRQTLEVLRYLVDPRTRHDHWWWADVGPGIAQLRLAVEQARRKLRSTRGQDSRDHRDTDGRRPPFAPANVRSVLWICSGNVCRSPFAERLLGAKAPGIGSRSAGLHAQPGASVPDWVRGFYEQHAVGWDDHRSTAISDDLVASSDVIVCMERAHQAELEQRFPVARGKTWLVGELGGLSQRELDDPYMLDVFAMARIFDQLADATLRVAESLNGRPMAITEARS
jgi:protein-tyrosine-phosphatase/predicted ATP-grasp superfamily ATP-dependent carboligase